MWTKLKELFKGTPKPPRMIEVGRAKVTITENDGTAHTITFTGDCSEYGDWVFDAQYYVHAWQERCGRYGTAGVGRGVFIPMCNVKRIEIAHAEHQIEAQQ